MTATVVVNPPGLPGPFSNFHARKRSKHRRYDPLLSPIRSARLIGYDDSAGSAFERSLHTHTSSDPFANSMDGLLMSSDRAPAKPKKKHLSINLPGRRSLDNQSRDATPPESTTPLDSTDSEAQPSRFKHARSISRDKYLKSFSKRFQDKDDDDSTIDFSLTMEENEKRSGIAISSQSQSPEATYNGHFSRIKGHNRSWSANAVLASAIQGPRPELDFVGPYRPRSPLTNRHSFTDLEWKLCPNAVDSREASLGFEPGTGPPQRASTFDLAGLSPTSEPPTGATSSTSHGWNTIARGSAGRRFRPKTKSRLSNGSSAKVSVNSSQSTLASTPAQQTRSRRDTAQSVDSNAIGSPLARTSTDRSFNFKRGFSSTSKEVAPITEADRLAAIDSAREEFKRKQAEKAQRYDEQRRRAREKNDRKLQQRQEKQRKRSASTISSKLESKHNVSQQPLTGLDDLARCNLKGPQPSAVSYRRESSVDSVKFEHTPRLTKDKQSTGSSSGFIAWCKSHLLHR